MAKGPPKKKESPVETFEEIEQGTEEWFSLRLGIPTASNFSTVMANGKDGEASKTRAELMRKLAGEVMTGRPAEGKITTAAMDRGNLMEASARRHYERSTLADLKRIGFMRRKLPSGRYVGASPDALIVDDPKKAPRRGLEIKTMAPHLMIERLEKGAGMPPEHKAQVCGTMWVGDLDEVDLLLFYEGMPVAPKFTVFREANEAYIDNLVRELEIFDHELHKLVAKIRSMGVN